MAPLVLDGKIVGLVGQTVDRTAQMEAERRLAESEARFRAAIDALPCGFFVCDLEGRNLLQNRVDREMWGDAIGKTHDEFDLPPEIVERVPEIIARVKAGEEVRFELGYEWRGRRYEIEKAYAPIDQDGVITGYVASPSTTPRGSRASAGSRKARRGSRRCSTPCPARSSSAISRAATSPEQRRPGSLGGLHRQDA